MTEMHDNDRIYRDMAGPVTDAELRQVRKLLEEWAKATEKAGNPNLRITFLACVNTLGTMGPAYARLAAINLLARAKAAEAN